MSSQSIASFPPARANAEASTVSRVVNLQDEFEVAERWMTTLDQVGHSHVGG
ncbi:MAG: hypothetical protein MUO58_03455 [Anaerolineales bacterium]|nr:hypothetical protein [Anaerolineales bacterium]